MDESMSDHGWNVVNSFAEGRMNREVPASNEDIDETLAERHAARAVFVRAENPVKKAATEPGPELYKGLYIRDKFDSQPQSRVIGGIATRGSF